MPTTMRANPKMVSVKRFWVMLFSYMGLVGLAYEVFFWGSMLLLIYGDVDISLEAEDPVC
jgi:hypothetical protein